MVVRSATVTIGEREMGSEPKSKRIVKVLLIIAAVWGWVWFLFLCYVFGGLYLHFPH